MKLNKTLTIALIILLIILVSIVSFVGVYTQDNYKMKSLIEEYEFTSDLDGYVKIVLAVDDSTNTVYYDKDGNKVDQKAEDGTEEQVPVNPEENLTKENYIKTRKIIEERLASVENKLANIEIMRYAVTETDINDYIIRQDEEDGKIEIYLPDNEYASISMYLATTPGKFTVEDSNGKVFLDNADLQRVVPQYGISSSGSLAQKLAFVFKDDAKEKISELNDAILDIPVDVTTDSAENSTEENSDENEYKIMIKCDGVELGTVEDYITSKTIEIDESFNSGLNYAMLLPGEALPVIYESPTADRYINSDITDEIIVEIGLAVAIIIVIALVGLIIKYKKNGLLASIAFIGYVALLLLVIRYTHIDISIPGAFGILVNFIINYILSIHLLNLLKSENNENGVKRAFNNGMLSMLLILVPVLLIGITLTLATWLTVYSFGAIVFWGILLMIVYQWVVTRTLLVCGAKKE